MFREWKKDVYYITLTRWRYLERNIVCFAFRPFSSRLQFLGGFCRCHSLLCGCPSILQYKYIYLNVILYYPSGSDRRKVLLCRGGPYSSILMMIFIFILYSYDNEF